MRRFSSALLTNERPIWVYTPSGYPRDRLPYGVLFLFDGFIYANVIPTTTMLDNLYAAGQIPPLVAVMVGNPDTEARMRELSC